MDTNDFTKLADTAMQSTWVTWAHEKRHGLLDEARMAAIANAAAGPLVAALGNLPLDQMLSAAITITTQMLRTTQALLVVNLETDQEIQRTLWRPSPN